MTTTEPGVPAADTESAGGGAAVPADRDAVLAARWRGVAAESADEITAPMSALLRGRSHRLLRDLLRPHRRGLLASAGLIVGFDVASMVGPFLVQQGIDRGIPPLVHQHRLLPLLLISIGLAAAGTLQAVTDYWFTRLTGRIGQDVLLDLRRRVFAHFQALSISFHERYTSGRVISRLTSDIDAISDLLQDGLQVLTWALLTVVSVAALMVWLDPVLAGVVFLASPAVVLLTRWFRRNSSRAYRATREAIALVIVQFVESLGGIRAVQSFRREDRNQEIFEELNESYRSANAWTIRLGSVYGPGVKALGNIALAAVLLVGALRVEHGHITVGILAAFVLYLRRFIDPILDLSQFYNLFQAAAAALEKLSGVLEEEPSVPEPAADRARAPVADPERAAGELRMRSVSFGYRDNLVLHDLDLTIPAGQTVAVVGATGAGKSTVARLLARFYDPTSGVVTLDGVDLRDVTVDELRSRVVMVTQESFLFSRSVADNIAFGRPDAGRDEVLAAARAVGAEDFIVRLPDGFDTSVGKRGSGLSAGQRQLVSFARAFLADPDVLILDEATASLDIPSERLIQRALGTLLAGRTAVIIAHRLTTVEIADRVIVVDDGRIVEDGSPDELLSRQSRYQELHRAWADSLV
ncbi:MAG TPA: ABC transporter ATP-binding protein [Acidimicrobiales bacterium]|nr:ABC transporter ATP-binding protein [Acidimicrobiales bacterium]